MGNHYLIIARVTVFFSSNFEFLWKEIA